MTQAVSPLNSRILFLGSLSAQDKLVIEHHPRLKEIFYTAMSEQEIGRRLFQHANFMREIFEQHPGSDLESIYEQFFQDWNHRVELADEKFKQHPQVKRIKRAARFEKGEIETLIDDAGIFGADVVRPLMTLLEEADSIGGLLDSVREIPHAQQADVLASCKPLLKKAVSDANRDSIITIALEAPSHERKEFMSLLEAELTNVSDDYFDNLLDFLNNNCITKLLEFIKKWRSLPTSIKTMLLENLYIANWTDAYDVVDHLAIISKTSEKELIAFLQAHAEWELEAEPLLILRNDPSLLPLSNILIEASSATSSPVFYLLSALSKVRKEERQEVVDLARKWMPQPNRCRDFANLLEALGHLSKENRQMLVQDEALQAFASSLNASIFLAIVQRLPFTFFPKLSPFFLSDYADAHFFLVSCLELLQEVPTSWGELWDKSEQALLRLDDPKKARTFASKVVHMVRTGQIAEASTFYQQAMLILFSTSRAAQQRLDNPYNVYATHLNERKCSITFTFETPDTVQLRINRIPPLKACQISASNLPKNISFEGITELFSAFENRIHILSDAQRANLLQQVKEMTSFSYEEIKADFLDMTLREILKADPLSNRYTARLFWVIHFIKTREIKPANPDELSEQEVTLFKAAASIRECPAGKKAGIAIYYNTLPSNFQISNISKTTSVPDELLQDFIQKWWQKEIMEQLSADNAMMREMAEMEGAIKQLSHFTLFVINRIGPRLGLADLVTFDPHTELLSAGLLRSDTKRLLGIFYKHVLPSQITLDFMNAINRDMQEQKGLYRGVHDKFPEANNWQLDESLTKAELTFDGATAILKRFSYLI